MRVFYLVTFLRPSADPPSQVEYDSLGFLEKNRDSLPSGAVELLQSSNNDLIKLIFLGMMM